VLLLCSLHFLACRACLPLSRAAPGAAASLLQTLGEQGEVDAAQAAAAEADQLRVQHTMLEQTAQARANARTGRNLHQKVRCGSIMATAAGRKARAVGCAAEHSLHNLQFFTAPGVPVFGCGCGLLRCPGLVPAGFELTCRVVPCRAVLCRCARSAG
jgi:hypothetical protein